MYVGVTAVIVVVAGLGAALGLHHEPERPLVVTQPVLAEPVVPPPPPPPLVAQPATVEFQVATDPPGATVSQGGRILGLTPMTVSVAREGAAPAQVELTFSLEGFEEASVVAQGVEGAVQVRQRLTERPVPEPTPATRPPRRKAAAGKPETPVGYKDDPYQ